MTAEEILASVTEVYSSLSCYTDRGSVVTHFPESPHVRENRKTFCTAFMRPNRFRFECQSDRAGTPSGRYVIWADGEDVRTYWDVAPLKQGQSLAFAIAGATGITYGAAKAIPVLLIGGSALGRRPTDLANAEILTNELINGVDCYRIIGEPHGKGPGTSKLRDLEHTIGKKIERSPRTLWIEYGSFLIRRIDTETKIGAVRSQTRIEYEPSVDVELSEAHLTSRGG